MYDNDENKVLIYWYFDLNDSDKQNLANMLRSLLRQLSAKTDEFPEGLRRISDRHRRRGSRPRVEQILPELHNIIASLKAKDVFLVLDALDEYSEDRGDIKRRDLLQIIEELVEQGHTNLHILTTSREESDIGSCLRKLTNPPRELNVEEPLLADLETFYENAMNTHSLKGLDASVKRKIKRRLMDSEQRYN